MPIRPHQKRMIEAENVQVFTSPTRLSQFEYLIFQNGNFITASMLRDLCKGYAKSGEYQGNEHKRLLWHNPTCYVQPKEGISTPELHTAILSHQEIPALEGHGGYDGLFFVYYFVIDETAPDIQTVLDEIPVWRITEYRHPVVPSPPDTELPRFSNPGRLKHYPEKVPKEPKVQIGSSPSWLENWLDRTLNESLYFRRCVDFDHPSEKKKMRIARFEPYWAFAAWTHKGLAKFLKCDFRASLLSPHCPGRTVLCEYIPQHRHERIPRYYFWDAERAHLAASKMSAELWSLYACDAIELIRDEWEVKEVKVL